MHTPLNVIISPVTQALAHHQETTEWPKQTLV